MNLEIDFETNPQDLIVFIARAGDTLVTDSCAVALAFGKRHKNVLRTIDAMRASERSVIAQHGQFNFEPSSCLNGQGKRRPMYRMTAKGQSELAMGFSGDDSRLVRIRFIDAFEEVAKGLTRAERSLVERQHALVRREVRGPTPHSRRQRQELRRPDPAAASYFGVGRRGAGARGHALGAVIAAQTRRRWQRCCSWSP